jgi:hypothetical protein
VRTKLCCGHETSKAYFFPGRGWQCEVCDGVQAAKYGTEPVPPQETLQPKFLDTSCEWPNAFIGTEEYSTLLEALESITATAREVKKNNTPEFMEHLQERIGRAMKAIERAQKERVAD